MAQPGGPKADVPSLAGTKRKRPAEKKYYAVKIGKEPGVYETWDQCLAQVTGQKGAQFKSFTTIEDARSYVAGTLKELPTKQPGEQKFYAVQQGKVPGVYLDWPSAQAQVSGFRYPKHKKFNTRAEAEAFVAEGKRKSAYDLGSGIDPQEEIRRLIVKNSAPGLVTNGNHVPRDPKTGEELDLARGPLPPGAQDGYDPNIKLDLEGQIINRTEEEKAATKVIPRDPTEAGMLRIYTDGSSLKNGQAGARAGVGVFFGPQDPKYDSPSSHYPTAEIPLYTMDWVARGAETKTKKRRKLTWRYRNVSEALKGSRQTNQRAELTAIQRALDIAPSHRDVTIYTDSKYSIDCVTNWYKGWIRNGWINSKGKPVENRDVIQDIREKMEERDMLSKKTFFVWVKGHANDAGNIAADRLAVAGAMSGRSADDDDDLATSSTRESTMADSETATDADESVSKNESAEEMEVEASLQLMQEAMKNVAQRTGPP